MIRFPLPLLIRKSFKVCTNSDRVLATVQNGSNNDNIAIEAIVYRKRKFRRNHSVISVTDRMNAAIEHERVNFSSQGIEEIHADARFLFFVEKIALQQVL